MGRRIAVGKSLLEILCFSAFFMWILYIFDGCLLKESGFKQ
jgi:preprotein translocase subunit SecE